MKTRRPLTSRPTWGALFGVVPDRGMRRRPSEVVRVALGALVVLVGALRARDLGLLDRAVRDVVQALPSAALEVLRVLNGFGTLTALLAVFAAAVAARRIRFIGGVLVAGVVAAGLTLVLQAWVDAPGALASSGVQPPLPDYPSLRLAVLAAVFFVAAPELTRPARRVQWILLAGVWASALAVTDGYPSALLGSLALGWAVAAAVHLAFGSPDGVPDPGLVRREVADLGVDVGPLESVPAPSWGEAAFEGADDEGRLRIVVIGRDATDARFFAKLAQSIWYKDSGSLLVLSRPAQIEHRAYLLLLAERAGVAAPRVVNDGQVGRGDAVLVLRCAPGRALSTLEPEDVADGVLAGAWSLLASLHDVGLSHGGITPDALAVAGDGSVAFVDLATSDASPEPSALLADKAAMLVTLSLAAGEDRAVASGLAALGTEGLAEVLTVLQPPALPRALRGRDVRHLTAQLRDAVAERTAVEAPQLVELRRVSPASLAMAAGAALGVYLLIGQLSEVDFATTFDGANWWWIPVVALFSQMPQFGNAIAMLGSVARPLPMRPVVGVQFANNFTGLVGGTVATTAMIVRFFQRQGMSAAVAVSSGVLTSVAAAVLQVLFVVVAFLLVGDTFDLGSDGGGVPGGLILLIVVAVAVVIAAVMVVPKLRRRLWALVAPQLHAARENLTSVLSEPRKAVQLFGGNLLAQTFFALTLWAALECYGTSLGLLQLILINSLASFLGGVAPVPGGMGVIEAGLIAGFTAAGVPQDQAVAATFTARLFTAYLPPIWGWFALDWLRRREYV